MPDAQLHHLAHSSKYCSYKSLADHCSSIQEQHLKCRQLAIGALSLKEDELKLACNAAMKAAKNESNQYKKVSSVIWVIRVLVERGMIREANKVAGFAFAEAKSIVPSNSRAYALEALCDQTWKLDQKYRRSILSELFKMIDSMPGWRIGRALAHISEDFETAGEGDTVDQYLNKCKNQWLKGRISRSRLKSKPK